MPEKPSKAVKEPVQVPAGEFPRTTRVADWMFLQPSVLDHTHDAVIIADLEGVVLGCNRAVVDIYGCTPEELTGKNVAVLYAEDDLPLLRNTILPAVLETGEFRGEIQTRTRTGGRPYIHLSVALLRDEDKKPVGMVGFSVNVTSQKLGDLAMLRTGDVERERDALQESSGRMQLLFNAVEKAEDVVVITEAEPTDQPGPRVLYVNQAFERMTGYNRTEIIGQTPRILQGPKSDRAALDRINAALKTWTPIRERLLNYRKDGTEFYVELSIFPLADEKGWFTHWISIQRDVTEQHALEERRFESEESYRILTECLPQLVWASSGDGKKVFCNSRYFEYTGAQSLTEVDELWADFVHPDDQARVVAKWKQSIATGQRYECEYRFRRKDGVYRHFLAQAMPIPAADGTVERWLGSSTDVHDQKLTEVALRHTEKLAAAGRLAASMAHEINNPLSAAINSLYIVMLDANLSDGNRAYLQQAEAQLARVAHVTTQTLGFFRQSTAPVTADMGQIMNAALSLFSERFETHGIGLIKLYRLAAPMLCCRDEVHQVFVNIISNALDAIRTRGRVVVHIAESHLWNDAGTAGVRVTIADNGEGVPVEVRGRMFEAFMSTKEATGTGLGLWVVKNLVEKHKGRVAVRSSTNRRRHGTVVSIFFPYDGLV